VEKQIKRHRIFSIGLEYYFLFIITLTLSIIGMVMIASASISVGERIFNDPYWFIRRQVIWWFISFIFFLIASRIDYKKYRRFSIFIMLIVVGLLALVLIPGFIHRFLSYFLYPFLSFLLAGFASIYLEVSPRLSY